MNLIPAHAYLNRHSLAGVEKSVHVVVEKRPHTVVETQSLPHAITEHETRIVNRNDSLLPWNYVTVNEYLKRSVARVFFGIMRGQAF